MSLSIGTSGLCGCCTKYQNSVCFKIWIVIGICSLMCFTCLVIENRRDQLQRNRNITGKHRAQKLIQIKTNVPYDEIEDTGSGGYAQDVSLHITEQYAESPNEIDQNYDGKKSDAQEMLSASNCITKSSDHLDFPRKLTKMECDSCEYSETQAQNILFDCDTIPDVATVLSNENQFIDQWIGNIDEELDTLSMEMNSDNENYNLMSESNEPTLTSYDVEDRFFPDEYAFQIEPSEENLSAELSLQSQINSPNLRQMENIVLPANDVDIPSMLDNFFGKISTLFSPPTPIKNSYHNAPHLSNFRDNLLSGENMRGAASEVNPIWNIHGSSIRRPVGVNSYSTRTKNKLTRFPSIIFGAKKDNKFIKKN